MDLNLKNKVVVISGGGNGIGASIAELAVMEGAKVAIIDFQKEDSSEIAKKLKNQGGAYIWVCKNLNEDSAGEQVIKEVVSAFGRIDVLVNNAGVNDGVGLEKGSPVKFRQSLLNNLGHYFDLTHFALPYLKISKGCVLNISSKTALTGQGNTSGYTAAKGAILALTREWAVELAPAGIRVNAIVPAEVDTPQYESWLSSFPNPQQAKKQITENIPFEKRMTSSEEIAKTAIFLMSSASSHTTGQWVVVDGGYVHLDRAMK